MPPDETQKGAPSDAGRTDRIVISIDAMGGDRGAVAVVAGMADSLAHCPDLEFLVHGPRPDLEALIARRPELNGRATICHSEGVVTMEDKPSQVMRHGQDTSMWSTLDAVKDGRAAAAVSCGNTGALMAVSMLRLRKLPGVNRPAIACLWPNRAPRGFAVMLDVGADIKADAPDLLQYALMGASYARNGLGLARPRVGLLNVGTEDHKGRAEIREAQDLIAGATEAGSFDYVGFVEGSDLPSGRVDVIVTDGFTGNIALKTGEGTAKLIGDFLREAFNSTILSRLGALLALGAMRRLQKRIDPRRVNGGVFLGLNGTVVKSHGSADATGVSAAIQLARRLAASGFTERLKARVASAAAPGQDAATDTGEQNGSAE
ncbi:MAG: phosphate acyltransferase PlsX [Paracoccaceae bacterium]